VATRWKKISEADPSRSARALASYFFSFVDGAAAGRVAGATAAGMAKGNIVSTTDFSERADIMDNPIHVAVKTPAITLVMVCAREVAPPAPNTELDED